MSDHDHQWVEMTTLQDPTRHEICTAHGCDAERTTTPTGRVHLIEPTQIGGPSAVTGL